MGNVPEVKVYVSLGQNIARYGFDLYAIAVKYQQASISPLSQHC